MTDTGPPYPPPPGPGSNEIGQFTIGVSPIGDIMPFDIWKTVISQYANSPTITTLIENMQDYLDPTKKLSDFYDLIWNVDTAQGYGLDVWGRIVGIDRVLQIQNADYFGFTEAVPGVFGFNQFPFYSGETLTDNFKLSDESFRLLILAKAFANICDGSIPSINKLLLSLFPNRGNCYVRLPQLVPYFGFAEASNINPSYIRGFGDINISDVGYFGFAEASGGVGLTTGFNQGPFFSLYYQPSFPNPGGYAPFYSGQHISHMEIAYVFEFPLTPVETNIVLFSGVLPTPVGVFASIVTP